MEYGWLRDALRFSLKASAYSVTIEDGPGPPEQRDPRFRKLIEGLLYSRQLILTYHLVLVGVIFILSATHWAQIAIRWKSRRASRLRILRSSNIYDEDAARLRDPSYSMIGSGRESEIICSSRSSTIDCIDSPPMKGSDDNEGSPLLHQGHALQPSYPQMSILSKTKAALMYQPMPIPLFNKALPSNGVSIILLAFTGLNIFYMFFHININIFELFVLADRFGLMFVANLPLLYLLAAKNQPLKLLTGRSYESLNIFHRRLGEILCLEALFHCAGMFVVWYTLLRRGGFGLVQFLLDTVILLGIVAFISYEVLYFTSLSSFRKRWYEVFLGLHISLQFAGSVLVFFHHTTARPYVGVALGIFLIDRVVYRLCIKSMTVEARTKIFEDEETVRLSTTILLQAGSRLSGIVGEPVTTGWRATDHIFITVPSLSRKHIFQAHPFTIASAAPNTGDEESTLDLLIRAQDGFSRDLLNSCRLHKTLAVRIDGPYGTSEARNMLEDSELALVVAGGSGIAVGWPLIQCLLDSTRSSDNEIASIYFLGKQRIILIWVIHDGSHISWVGRPALAAAEKRGAEIIIPEATDEIGRPDLRKMINEVVKESCREKSQKIRVVASGPDSMGRLVRNTCARLVRDGRDVDVMIEKFGW